MATGKIVKLSSTPKGFILRIPPVPPSEEPTDVTYLCDADQLTVAAAAYAKGSDAEVTGTAPSCSGVSAT